MAAHGSVQPENIFDFIDEAGLSTGVIILIFSLYLFVQGHRRLDVIGAAAAAMVGYIFAPEAHEAAMSLDLFTLDPTLFQNTFAIICAGLGMVIMRVTVRSLAVFITFLFVYTLIQFSGRFGVDLEGGYILPGVLSIVPFFFIRKLQEILPKLLSALLGSTGMLTFCIIAFDLSPTYLDVETSLVPFVVLPLSVGSWLLQSRDERIQEEKREKEENPPSLPLYQEEQLAGTTFGNTTMPLFLDAED